MKIRKGNLLTVILALLCAVAVALGVAFALPKNQSITADAAASEPLVIYEGTGCYYYMNTNCSSSQGEAINTSSSLTTISGTAATYPAGSTYDGDTYTDYTTAQASTYGECSFNPDSTSSGTLKVAKAHGTKTIGNAKRYLVSYIEFKSKVMVPARTTYTVVYTGQLSSSCYTGSGTPASTGGNAWTVLYIYEENASARASTFGYQSSGFSNDYDYKKVIGNSRTGAGGGTKEYTATYTNNTDNPKEFNSYFGALMSCIPGASAGYKYDGTVTVSAAVAQTTPTADPETAEYNEQSQDFTIKDLATLTEVTYMGYAPNSTLQTQYTYDPGTNTTTGTNPITKSGTNDIFSATEAGVYKLKFKRDDGTSAWLYKDNNNQDQFDSSVYRTVTITITPKMLTIPTVYEPEQEYSAAGCKFSVISNLNNTDYNATLMETVLPNTGGITWNATDLQFEATNVAKYNVAFKLQDKNNYVWGLVNADRTPKLDANGDQETSNADQTVELEITKKKVTVPTIVDPTQTYKADEYEFELDDFDKDYVEIIQSDIITTVLGTVMTWDDTNEKLKATDAATYTVKFKLKDTSNCVWATTNNTTNQPATVTIDKKEIEITTNPAASSSPSWELGATGSIVLTVTATGLVTPDYDLDYYYVKTTDVGNSLTDGLDTTALTLDVSQISQTGIYELCVKLKDASAVPANKNYTIKNATGGVYKMTFGIGAAAINFSAINWQYSEETASNPLYDLFIGGSQQTLLYKYNEASTSAVPYFITAEIPAAANSYLSVDTSYNATFNGNSFSGGFYTEYLGVDGLAIPVPVQFADKAGTYRTLIVLDTDTDHLFTSEPNYGPVNSAGTKGWYEVTWIVSKATISQTDLTELNKHLQWRVPGVSDWQNFDPDTTTLSYCGKEIEVQVDPSAYPHGITGIDTTYGDNGYTNAKGTNGNTYTATVKYTVDDNYNTVPVQNFDWKVGALVLNPEVNSYTYSGGEVDLKSLMNLTVDQWEYITVSSGTTKATDVDEYTAVLTIKPEYFGGVVWSTSNIAPAKKLAKLSLTDAASASADCTVKWKIVKAILNGAWGDAEDSGKVPPVNLSSASVADIPSELLVYTYKDLSSGQTVDANKLQGGREYEVTVGLNTSDPRSNNYIFNAPAAYRITTPETGPNLWQKVSNFMTQEWMGMPIWAWFLIGLALLILLIIIIVVACKRRKTKEEKAEIKARKEEEKQRREEERQRQEEERRRREEEREEEKRRREEERAEEKRRREEEREEERRRQQEKLEAERELAKARQEAELEKIKAQAAANAGMAGMASMAMAQPQQQQVPPQPVQQPVQQVVDNTNNELLKELREQLSEMRADNKLTRAQLQELQNKQIQQQNQQAQQAMMPMPQQYPQMPMMQQYPQYPMYQQMPMGMPYGGNDLALARMEAQLNAMQAEQRARYDAEQRIELAAMRAESHVDRDSRHSVDLAAMREHINGYNYNRLPEYNQPAQLPYNGQQPNMDMMGALVAATLKNMANGEAAATQVPELPQNTEQNPTVAAKYPSDAVITTTTTVDTTKNKPLRRDENFDIDGFYEPLD